MLLVSPAIRCWLLFAMITIVTSLPLFVAANTDFVVTETCEYENDSEDSGSEFFDLIAPPASMPLVLLPGLRRDVTHDLAENDSIFAVVHLQRGPPLG